MYLRDLITLFFRQKCPSSVTFVLLPSLRRGVFSDTSIPPTTKMFSNVSFVSSPVPGGTKSRDMLIQSTIAIYIAAQNVTSPVQGKITLIDT